MGGKECTVYDSVECGTMDGYDTFVSYCVKIDCHLDSTVGGETVSCFGTVDSTCLVCVRGPWSVTVIMISWFNTDVSTCAISGREVGESPDVTVVGDEAGVKKFVFDAHSSVSEWSGALFGEVGVSEDLSNGSTLVCVVGSCRAASFVIHMVGDFPFDDRACAGDPILAVLAEVSEWSSEVKVRLRLLIRMVCRLIVFLILIRLLMWRRLVRVRACRIRLLLVVLLVMVLCTRLVGPRVCTALWMRRGWFVRP